MSVWVDMWVCVVVRVWLCVCSEWEGGGVSMPGVFPYTMLILFWAYYTWAKIDVYYIHNVVLLILD